MQDHVPDRSLNDTAPVRGSNQSDMRAYNERLILTLVRRQGALAKSDLARLSGLSAQTASVIMRGLESAGLLLRQEPVRGRIGQPSVPMALDPEGAFFLGLKLGRRSADLTLIDFLGRVRASERTLYAYPTPETVHDFVERARHAVVRSLPEDRRNRIRGLGVAMPFRMWEWVQMIGAPQAAMEAWRDHDIQSALAVQTGLPVQVQNDASSACGAELLFGGGDRPRNFLYIYFGTFVGGGLVLNGQLFLGATGNAAGVGSMPVPGVTGGMGSLISAASMQVLADEMLAAGESPEHLWEQPDEWRVSRPILTRWMDRAAMGLAWASLSATALLELDAVLIDGWMPPAIRAEIVARTRTHLTDLDLKGVEPPAIGEGTVGAYARSLGAAAIPLAQHFMIDQNAAYRV